MKKVIYFKEKRTSMFNQIKKKKLTLLIQDKEEILNA